MSIRFPAITLACALSFFPQAVHSQGLPEQSASPPERRGLRIILDGAERADEPAGGRTAPIAAAPIGQALPPLPGAAPAAETVAPRPSSQPPPDWTADALRIPMTPGEGFRIQVGAFSDAARAEAQIAALELLAAGPGADPIRLVVPAGEVYRAQMSGFADRAAADGACARITANGQACFVVAPQS